MKIITWNCNMAFRKKAGIVVAHNPDLVIVPECEHPGKLRFETGVSLPNDIFWFGNNQNKGLGVFSYSNFKIRLSEAHCADFRTILPLVVSNPQHEITLFSIWANNPDDKGYQYVGQVWKAIRFYAELLKNKKTILVGDFNSNSIWDKPRREGNHSNVVGFLEEKGIHSTYHRFFKQIQGKEKQHTLFMYRDKNKSYHIDYCFASTYLINKLRHVEVGKHKDWCKYSDHTPLMVTFDL